MYPVNLAPQTPSAKYDIVAVKNDPLFVILRGNVFETVIGALSRCRIDLPYYDGSVIRDQFDVTNIGRSPVMMEAVVTSSGVYLGDLYSNNGDAVIIDNAPVTGTSIKDAILTDMEQDDNFTHTPPHQNVMALTEVRYFDGAGGAGNLVGSFRVDRWLGDGSKIPQFLGTPPPIYDPNATE